jgi:probable HAF family extracellular repeat protein
MFDSAFMTVGQVADGATIRMYYRVQHWSATSTTTWKNPPCGESRFTGTYILGIDNEGRIAVTFDPSYESAGIDLENPASVRDNLPIAVIVQKQKCTVLGNAILMAVDGKFAAGYLGFLDGKAAPASVDVMVQKMVAFRWIGKKQITLGAGVPYAISRTGLTAGASALPGHAKEVVYGNMLGPAGRYGYAHPHATAWLPNGREVRLVRNDERSSAWDVSEDGTIVGMEQLKDGKHYAFRWKNGRLERLDDLPHPRGWRFESAYAIAHDGSIVGIGTYNGVATAFVWSE